MINKVAFNEYKHPYKSREEIERLGFVWSYHYKSYIYKFPVYKYNGRTVLECLVFINPYMSYTETMPGEPIFIEDTARIAVKSTNWNCFYATFYDFNEGQKDFIIQLNRKIKRKLCELRIETTLCKE